MLLFLFSPDPEKQVCCPRNDRSHYETLLLVTLL